MTSVELKRIHPESLIPTPDNPRNLNTDTPEWAEWVETIRAQGVLIPVIARPHPDVTGMYDLRAGERRVTAAGQAGLEDVPVLVHHGMDDEAAMRLTVVENMEREDLSPIEESSGVETLLRVHNGDIEAVASRLGRPASWVARRAKLSDLSEAWRLALVDGVQWPYGDPIRLDNWTAGHLELIARMPEDVQLDILREFDRSDATISIKDLREHIDTHFLRLLRKAPWKLDEALAEEPACSDCPRRSDREALLFHEAQEDAAKNAQCLDAGCWQKKELAWLKSHIKVLAEKHPDLVFIGSKDASYNDNLEAERELGVKLLGSYTYEASRKDARDSIPALVVSGPKAVGSVRWIKIKDHYRDRPEAAGAGAEKPKKTLAEKRAELDSKRWAHVLKALEAKIRKIRRLDLPQDINGAFGMVALAAAFGTNHRNDAPGIVREYTCNGTKEIDVHDWFCTATCDGEINLHDELWRSIRPVLASRVRYNGPVTKVPKVLHDEAFDLGELLKIDVDELLADAAQAIPEPKSWAKEEVKEETTTTKPTEAELIEEAKASDLVGFAFYDESGDAYSVEERNGEWYIDTGGELPDVLEGSRKSREDMEQLLTGWAILHDWPPCCRECWEDEDEIRRGLKANGIDASNIWAKQGLCVKCAEEDGTEGDDG